MKNCFSENLKKIRKENNLSQEQLAFELGVSRQAISKWESDVAYPEMDKIITLCKKFNVKIDDLLYEDIKEIKNEEESKKKLNEHIDDFLNFITDTINLFGNMNLKSKIHCFIEQLVIGIVLFLIAYLGMVLGDWLIFENLRYFVPYRIRFYLEIILKTVYAIFMIICSITILVHIFKTRYLDYYNKLKEDSSKEEIINPKKEEKVEKEESTNFQNINKKNKILFKLNENKIIIRDPKHSEYRFIHSLLKFVVGFLKFFALCLTLPIALVLIFIFIGFVLSFLVYKTGFLFVGLLGICLSLGLFTMSILIFLLNFILSRKNNKKKILISFVTSVVSFGISIGFFLMGTLSFDILPENENETKTEIIEIEMPEEGFYDHPYYNIEYIESDNTNLRIEYTISKFYKLEKISGNTLSFYTYCDNPIGMYREFIENLNHKKIVPLTSDIENIKVYTTKENIAKIKRLD